MELDQSDYVPERSLLKDQFIQLLHPIGLHCDSKTTTSNTQDGKTLNFIAEEFRPKRLTAAIAEQRIKTLQTMNISERHLVYITK